MMRSHSHKINLALAYDYCQRLARSHYENFPVASILLPERLQKPISVIYAFARTADDFADEGDLSQDTRLQQLQNYHDNIDSVYRDSYGGDDPVFIALSDVIAQHHLPRCLFENLLSAFKQDVVKNRYANFAELLDYCRRSADPVGRLLLYLNGSPAKEQLEQSDAVCTALQLINFYQDIVQDYTESNRIYIPQDQLGKAGISESDLISPDTHRIAPVIRNLYHCAEQKMQKGYLLGTQLSGRVGWEIRAMTLGGITTLDLLKQQSDENLLTRPRLTKSTLLKIIMTSANNACYRKTVARLLDV